MSLQNGGNTLFNSTISSTWTAARQVLYCARLLKQHTPPDCISRLLSHPRNDDIGFVKGGRGRAAFFQRSTGTIFRGLTKELENVFWDDKKIPPGMPDTTRSTHMGKVQAEADKRKLEAERMRRANIRALELEKKKRRNMFSGGGMDETGGFDDAMFSGGGTSDSFDNIIGVGGGGDQGGLSGSSMGSIIGGGKSSGSEVREIQVERIPNGLSDSSCDLSILDNVRVCYHNGSGLKHGTQVHNDMERIIEMILYESNRLGHLGSNPVDIFDDVPNQVSEYEKDRLKCISGVLKFMDPCAFSILNILVTRQIIPIRTEYAIYNELLTIATNVDMIAWDIKNSKGLIVEIKTGHNAQTNYNAHDGVSYLSIDHEGICMKDTALNRASIQLLFPLIFVRQLYGIDMDGGLIIRTASQVAEGQEKDTTPQFRQNSKSPQGSKANTKKKVTRFVQLYRIPHRLTDLQCQKIIYQAIESKVINQIIKCKKPAEVKHELRQKIKEAPQRETFWLNGNDKEYDQWYQKLFNAPTSTIPEREKNIINISTDLGDLDRQETASSLNSIIQGKNPLINRFSSTSSQSSSNTRGSCLKNRTQLNQLVQKKPAGKLKIVIPRHPQCQPRNEREKSDKRKQASPLALSRYQTPPTNRKKTELQKHREAKAIHRRSQKKTEKKIKQKNREKLLKKKAVRKKLEKKKPRKTNVTEKKKKKKKKQPNKTKKG